MTTEANIPRIGIVGPCTAGKTTLIRNLKVGGIDLRHIAQEHSYVQAMWHIIGKVDWLIFLDVSYEESLRRKNLNWTMAEYLEQQRRLLHARQHANFYVMTDGQTPDQVAQAVTGFLNTLSR